MTPAKHVAARIVALRRAKRMSRADLARRIGVPTERLLRWERGEHDPKLASIVRLAEGLGVTAADLVAGVEGRP